MLVIEDNPVDVCKEHLCMELQSGRELMRIVRKYHILELHMVRVWTDMTKHLIMCAKTSANLC